MTFHISRSTSILKTFTSMFRLILLKSGIEFCETASRLFDFEGCDVISLRTLEGFGNLTFNFVEKTIYL